MVFATITVFVVFGISESDFPLVYFRYFFGGLFIIWLPGFTFIKTLFPTKELDMFERIAFSLGMSLALVPVVVVILGLVIARKGWPRG